MNTILLKRLQINLHLSVFVALKYLSFARQLCYEQEVLHFTLEMVCCMYKPFYLYRKKKKVVPSCPVEPRNVTLVFVKSWYLLHHSIFILFIYFF